MPHCPLLLLRQTLRLILQLAVVVAEFVYFFLCRRHRSPMLLPLTFKLLFQLFYDLFQIVSIYHIDDLTPITYSVFFGSLWLWPRLGIPSRSLYRSFDVAIEGKSGYVCVAPVVRLKTDILFAAPIEFPCIINVIL
jgi:hypothetical protein